MISFTEWMRLKPFYIRDSWSNERNTMVGPGRMVLQPIQERIFQHCLTPGPDGKLPYTTILFSTTKKSGKSALGAAVSAWYEDQSNPGTEIYIMANDLEQAEGRVMRDVKYHVRRLNIENKDTEDDPIKINQYKILFPNDSFIQAMANNYRSSAGSRHSLTVWDELWGFSADDAMRLWDEMTPIPTVENSLRFIATYAGFSGESKLLWDLYLQGVGVEEHADGQGKKIPGLEDLPCWSNGRLFTYWNHEPTMPWQTQEYYDSEMQGLRASAYLRLHENRWVTTHESFIPMQWWDQAETAFPYPMSYDPDNKYRNYPVYMAIDGSQKHDCTAIVGVTYDREEKKCVQLFHKIWTPTEGETMDLRETVQAYTYEMWTKWNVVNIDYDPALLMQVMLELKGQGLPVHEFVQSNLNMIKASQAFYDLLKFSNYWAYPDEEVRSHIQNTVAQEESRGFRMVKDANKRRLKPMDFAIAAAMASYSAVNHLSAVSNTPITITSPFSDLTAKSDPEMMKIPFPFRE